MTATECASSPSVMGRHFRTIGSDIVAPAAVGHRVTDHGVTLVLPHGRDLTDAEAKKLAWGILADLAPEDVAPTPETVTYREATRLEILAAMRAGPLTINEIAGALGWKRSKTERRLRDLRQDGRVDRIKISPHDVRFRLVEDGQIRRRTGR